MIIDLLEKIEENGSDKLNLFFITRKLKDGVRSRDLVLEKYQFIVYSVDIDEEIQKHLFELTKKQFLYVIKKGLETTEYDVISDDSQQIFTYSMSNKAMSFADVVNEQLINKSKIPKLKDLGALIESEELWAYCVGFYDEENNWTYTFRKILKGKVVVENEEGKTKGKLSFFRTRFDSESSRLEMLHGETVNLDEKIDCIYYDNIFYIIQKTQFEQITGIAEEFKETAENVVKTLKETGLISGIEIFEKYVQEKPTVHKKLVKLSKLNNYAGLKKSDITKMLQIAKRYGGLLKKDNSGNLLLESEKDIEMTIKVLADFFKKGEFSGKPYGTYSGKEIKNTDK